LPIKTYLRVKTALEYAHNALKMSAPSDKPAKPTSARKTLNFPEQRYEALKRAAYWEGYPSLPEFIWDVMSRYMEERRPGRHDKMYSEIPKGQSVSGD